MSQPFDGPAADFIIATLKSFGIDTLFNYPGGTIAPLLDACGRYEVDIFTSVTEQGAGYAAISQAKIAQAPALVAVTSGPGVTNLCTCIAEAYFDAVPLIALTGQVGTADLSSQTPLRQQGFQEVDCCALMTPICKKVYQPTSAEQLPTLLVDAFTVANSGRKGPVVIDLPMDIQRANLAAHWLDKPPAHLPQYQQATLQAFTQTLINTLLQAKAPLVICGAGAASLSTTQLQTLRDLVEYWQLPVSHSLLGLGCIDSDSPLSLGYHGHCGHPAAGQAIHHADVILSLGSRLDVRQTGNQFDQFAPTASIFKVDFDADEIAHSRIRHDQVFIGDVGIFIADFAQQLLARTAPDLSEWHQRITDWKQARGYSYHSDGINPGEFIRHLSRHSWATEVIAVTGVGSHQHWTAREFRTCLPHRKLLTSGGHGTMGYDLPSAIGAAYANPEAQILCLVGDGSLQMNIQELAVLADKQLNIKVLVLNNRRLGLVSQFQLQNWEEDMGCGKKPAIDFAAIARAYGIPATSIERPDTMHKALEDTLAITGPYLLNVMISDQHDVIPMLLGGHTMNDMSY